jgi:SAM-dependent methyltransferase
VHEQQLDDVCRHIQVPHLAGPHPQFADHSFDVISAQFLSRVLTRDDWLPLLEECRRLLRPGGQIFLTDFGSSISNSPAHEEFWSRLIQWLRQSGRSFAPGNRHTGILCELEPLLSTVGFGKTRISCDIVNCSYGADYHEEWKRNFLVFSKRIMSFLLSQGLSTSEQIDRLLQRLQIEMNLPSFHALLPVLTVCGQK